MPRKKRRLSADPRTARVHQLAESPPLLLDDPGPSTKSERLAAYGVSEPVTKHGNSAEYLVARIARDRPDVLERMKAGEFATVWAAAREAGVVKKPGGLAANVLSVGDEGKSFAAVVREALEAFFFEGSI